MRPITRLSYLIQFPPCPIMGCALGIGTLVPYIFVVEGAFNSSSFIGILTWKHRNVYFNHYHDGQTAFHEESDRLFGMQKEKDKGP
jgi:hypothetical protein